MRLVDADLMRAHIKPYSIVDEGLLVTCGTSIRVMHTCRSTIHLGQSKKKG